MVSPVFAILSVIGISSVLSFYRQKVMRTSWERTFKWNQNLHCRSREPDTLHLFRVTCRRGFFADYWTKTIRIRIAQKLLTNFCEAPWQGRHAENSRSVGGDVLAHFWKKIRNMAKSPLHLLIIDIGRWFCCSCCVPRKCLLYQIKSFCWMQFVCA